MGEHRTIWINMPPPEDWPEGAPWEPLTKVRAHLDAAGDLYVAPLGSEDYPGPITIWAGDMPEHPLWLRAADHPALADAWRGWQTAGG